MNFYQPRARRNLYFGFGCILFFLTICYNLTPSPQRAVPDDGGNTVRLPSGCLIVWCGTWLVATSVRYRLTLTRDALIMRSAFSTKAMARRDIAGWRSTSNADAPTLYLFARGKTRPSMSISVDLQDHPEVKAWMKGIPYRS